MNKVLKAVLPRSYTLNTMEKPMQAGEIFYLWESLNAGNEIISLSENFMMNTQDKQLHKLLNDLLTETEKTRQLRIGSLLKDAGFTVPPRPAPKTIQGKPGVGQEVKLSDEEILRVINSILVGLLELDGRGIGAVTTNKKIGGIFIDLLNADMKYHENFLNLSKERQVIEMPPAATSAPDSLTMAEVYWLWCEMDYRHAAILELLTFMSNTKDTDILEEIKYGLNKVSIPELQKIEGILKKEGFTVPSRPVDRTNQQPEGRSNRIILSDAEILTLFLTAAQVAVNNHIRAYASSTRVDIIKLYSEFIQMEIDSMDRIMKLSKQRSILVKPPFVTSKRG